MVRAQKAQPAGARWRWLYGAVVVVVVPRTARARGVDAQLQRRVGVAPFVRRPQRHHDVLLQRPHRRRQVGIVGIAVVVVSVGVAVGVTGVVGPNGCGKSNLLEALRWVMGETSYKSMRGSGMEDVIFAGTNARPARNHAEVLLFLDNENRTAPAE